MTKAYLATAAAVDRRPGETPVLELDQARISYFTRAGEINVVPGISFKLFQGEALGLVGESGCGKSTVAFSVMKYLGGSGRLTGGRILFEGKDINTMREQELRAIRGSKLAMVYQDPMSSLNPVMTVGQQLMEVPIIHFGADAQTARQRALDMLAEVNLPDPSAVMERYPHQISGGQQQRVVIAMALMAEPSLLLMDEPTTGLDVTVEAAVLDLVAELRKRHNSSILFISHNLGTVVRICDRIGVMYSGELVEEGAIGPVFRNPRHPYTRGLLSCVPTLGSDKHSRPLQPIQGQVPLPNMRPRGCVFAPRCDFREEGTCTTARVPVFEVGDETSHTVQCARFTELPVWKIAKAGQGGAVGAPDSGRPVLNIERLKKVYTQSVGMFGGSVREVKALNDISIQAGQGKTLAIVGESGCGKSTLAKVLTGLEKATAGTVGLENDEIGSVPVDKRSSDIKRKLQMVFQNPDSTLNPSHSVGYAIGRSIRRLRGATRSEADAEVRRLLDVVNLPQPFARRKPRQLSGGQKQRVAIARALAGNPEVVIADEPVSALDVSVQAAIINLLIEIQADRDATLLFISHDLSVVRFLADFVAVMYLGKVVEFGSVEQVFSPPYHPYTEALLSAVPIADPDIEQKRILLGGTIPSPTNLPKGCPLATRCPRKIGDICDTVPPPEVDCGNGHRILCHIGLDELRQMDSVFSVAAE